ncbi:MAG TPA: sigma factor-like helix-turn-helix DNA-binding protein, partial [Roseiflexaceae bacterium]|nr:sigma factor-like helix-turn-helix DNA-binding protein [Roseiflexaceae bacterium]
VGPWLPEPILTATASGVVDPEKQIETAESISLAFLVLLEQFQPFERAVFLLRESFGYEYAEIAAMLGKSEVACRRSFSRARQHVREHRPRFPASRDQHRELLGSFIQAVEHGEMQTLTRLLAEDVTLWADAGGKRPQAALRPIRGRDAVARFSVASLRFLPGAYHAEFAEVNGQPAMIVRAGGEIFSVLTIEVEAGAIRAVYVLANPDKLARVG